MRCCTGQLLALAQSRHPLGCRLPSCHSGLQAFRHQTSAVIAGLPFLEEATTAHFQMQSAGPVSMEESDSQAAAVPQLQSADVAEAMDTGDKPELRNKGMQGGLLSGALRWPWHGMPAPLPQTTTLSAAMQMRCCIQSQANSTPERQELPRNARRSRNADHQSVTYSLTEVRMHETLLKTCSHLWHR